MERNHYSGLLLVTFVEKAEEEGAAAVCDADAEATWTEILQVSKGLQVQHCQRSKRPESLQ